MYPKSDAPKSVCKVYQKGKGEREDSLKATTGERRVVLQPGERSGVEGLWGRWPWIEILGRAGSQAQTNKHNSKCLAPAVSLKHKHLLSWHGFQWKLGLIPG